MPMKPKKKTRADTDDEDMMTPDEFLALPDDEKEGIYQHFNRPFRPEQLRPLTPKMRRAWNKFRQRHRGRPKVGEGAERVLVTIERGLLRQADEYAKRNGVTRSALMANGLLLAMGSPQRPSGESLDRVNRRHAGARKRLGGK
jgi:hypothetical protein